MEQVGVSTLGVLRSAMSVLDFFGELVHAALTALRVPRTLNLREPASLSAVTFLDRPYRRLVDDLPVRYVGFTVPDEFFVGYGFDLDERYRHLPDLRFAK